ncbi:MAG: 23S rRNA (adenine(2503)-C(2))-methyltransferase RlmN, partial [Lachnospiraceae bacterium]|nr:23S rRNA (adenine(2503)-C(2))-methyltransferase RlmN [Lachnospiraceae bacterium]
MSAERIDLKNLTLPELTETMLQMGEKAFRAKQLYGWMHRSMAAEYEQMSNLSIALKERLAAEYDHTVLKKARLQVSKLDGTRKYLFTLPDGNQIESVWMRYHHGNSVCISSQVGCRMGCSFCASTLGGLVRSLSAAEMLEQVYAMVRDTGERVSNIVIMGIGEPMDNYGNLLKFLHMITDENGLHISQRNITVSTCGLAEEGLSVTLALSLHAVTDEKRRQIMPVAKRYSIAELMEACDCYFAKTGRRISFEYSLIAGVNDTAEDAKGLAALALAHHAHVNLIPVNPVTERGYREPDRTAVEAFKKRLEAKQAAVTIRREMGRDIDSACGQLRRNEMLRDSQAADTGNRNI